MNLKVMIVGEGNNELGRELPSSHIKGVRRVPGVLEVLARKRRPDGWEVTRSVPWKDIPKYKVGVGTHAEERTVQRLLRFAEDPRDVEARVDVVIFARDSDHDPERKRSLEKAIAGLKPRRVRVAGGVAHPKLEGWILAMKGHRHTETMGDKKLDKLLSGYGCWLSQKNTDVLVSLVESADLAALPEDAACLLGWLERVDRALSPA